MEDVTHIITVIVMAIAEVVTLITSCLALGGGNWAETVSEQGDYFARVDNRQSISYLDSNRIHSVGMWRFFMMGDYDSTPLPIRGNLVGSFRVYPRYYNSIRFLIIEKTRNDPNFLSIKNICENFHIH